MLYLCAVKTLTQGVFRVCQFNTGMHRCITSALTPMQIQKPPSKCTEQVQRPGPSLSRIAPAWLLAYKCSVGQHQKGFVNCYLCSGISNKLNLSSACFPLTSLTTHHVFSCSFPGYSWPSHKQRSASGTSGRPILAFQKVTQTHDVLKKIVGFLCLVAVSNICKHLSLNITQTINRTFHKEYFADLVEN